MNQSRERLLFAHCRFLVSGAGPGSFPPDDRPEAAFAGRSNAGKSSALNAITGRRALARTSKTPGRTQLINFFALDEAARLVDLPGYGFAQVPEAVRQRWGELIEGYMGTRRHLRGVVVIMDIRHPMKPFDRQLLDWCAALSLPCHILLTKADKLGRGAGSRTLMSVQRMLARDTAGATVQLFSARTGQGVEDARRTLARWLAPGDPAAVAG